MSAGTQGGHSTSWVTRIVGAFIDSKLTPLILFFSLGLGGFAVLNLPREEEP